MTEAKKILEMIENVSPDDTDKLDEIDARVYGFKNNINFIKFEEDEMIGDFGDDMKYGTTNWAVYEKLDGKTIKRIIPQYTRSRDALKATRPEGFISSARHRPQQDSKVMFYFSMTDGAFDFCTPHLPTEELAELHAIIQSIQWERDNDNKRT